MGISSTLPFILASASPRRVELLKLAGLVFDVIPAAIDESALPREEPARHVMRLATEKALCVAASHPDCLVIGADTVVFIDGKILGKPASNEDARKMLAKLSGRGHEVYTGFCIANIASGIKLAECVRTTVVFREISPDEISWYVSTPEPYDKAGAYAAQGMSASFVKELHGSYTNVIGLPLSDVVEKLRMLGVIIFSGDK